MPNNSSTTKPKSYQFSAYTNQPVNQVLITLGVRSESGLSTEEANHLLSKFGLNQLKLKTVTPWQILIRQFQSPFVYLLIFAVLLSWILNEPIQALMILLFVFINALLGFMQEFRSHQAIKQLQKFITPHCQVIRDHQEAEIDTTQLVPGDIVILSPGTKAVADLRVVQDNHLIIDESVLTGESRPVNKQSAALPKKTSQIFKAKNIIFSGTTVTNGDGLGIVIATGKNTYLADLEKLTTETIKVTGLEQGMTAFSKFVLWLVVITLGLVYLANLLIKGPHTNQIQLLIFSIALAISAIPEALPLVLTFSLSRGALQLAKNKVVAKRLSAIEDLGGIEVLCTDKTGTITQNQMSVTSIWGADPQAVWLTARQTIDPQATHLTNSFDQALVDYSPSKATKLPTYQILAHHPFDPDRKRSSTLITTANHHSKLIVKGAIEGILPHCSPHVNQPDLDQWLDQQSQQGNRVIAVASRQDHFTPHYQVSEEEKHLTFVGCLAFSDPLKPTSKSAIDQAKKLGVQVKIITGDSPLVAGALAEKIGLITDRHQVLTGEDFDHLTLTQKHQAVNQYSVFARVAPPQKHQIIQLLEEHHQTGYIGDGINDAPALKAANVAIAVKKATDIAKDAADIILLKSDLQVIINGIQEGRQVFANTIKYIKLTMVSNLGNFYTLAIASLLTNYLPMLPIQILLLNLLTDFPLMAVSTDAVDPLEIRQPEHYDIKEFALIASLFGIVSTVFDFLFFGYFSRFTPSVLQTNWFVGSVLTELILVYSLRTVRPFYRTIRPSLVLSGLTLIAGFIAVVIPFTTLGQQLFGFTNPTLHFYLVILVLVIAYFICTETVKLLYYRRNLPNPSSLST